MASDFSRIDSLAARLVEPNHRSGHPDSDEDEDAIFAELEAEIENDDNPVIREKALEALKQEMDRVKELQRNKHGQYSEIMDEKEVIQVCAKEPRCVVHFYQPGFKRCEIMDKHLAKIAPKYFNTRFLRVMGENSPWLVSKLSIKVLPCVICFVDGVSKDRLIGFEELGNSDTFETAALEIRLQACGAIKRSQTEGLSSLVYRTGQPSIRPGDDDDDFDL